MEDNGLGEVLLASQVKAAREALQEWVDQQGHNRCWYYPDIFNRLCRILGVNPAKVPALPSLEEFREGCAKYQEQQYGNHGSGDAAASGLG